MTSKRHLNNFEKCQASASFLRPPFFFGQPEQPIKDPPEKSSGNFHPGRPGKTGVPHNKVIIHHLVVVREAAPVGDVPAGKVTFSGHRTHPQYNLQGSKDGTCEDCDGCLVNVAETPALPFAQTSKPGCVVLLARCNVELEGR